MSGPRLFIKLFVSSAVVLFAAIGITGLVIYHQARSQTLAEIERGLQNIAVSVEELTVSSGKRNALESLSRGLERIASNTGTDIVVTDEEGQTLAGSNIKTRFVGNLSSVPEIISAGRDGIGVDRRHSGEPGVDTMFLAVPIRSGEKTIGFVRVSRPVDAGGEGGDLFVFYVILFSIVTSGVIIFALSHYFAGRFSAPLKELDRMAGKIAEGDYQLKIRAGEAGELTALVNTFNSMSVRLSERLERIVGDRNQLLAIIGGMVEGVIAVNRDETVVHINRVACRILGADHYDSIGKRIWEITRKREISDAILSALHDKTELTREVRIFTDLQERIINLYASSLVDDDGKSQGAVVVLHDVTELRKLADMRMDLVTNVAHEFKTPLTAILTAAETISDDVSMTPETRSRFLEKIVRHAHSLSALSTDMLSLARSDDGDSATRTSPVDLVLLTRESVAEIKDGEKELNRHIELKLSDRPVVVEGDKTALQGVIDNLLDNAIKYTPEGGSISITVEKRNNSAVFIIEDTGIGIEKSEQDRIFERFYRVDKARSRHLGGTGLGLAIVDNVVQAHHGTIAVDSSPGKGSRFSIILPLAAQ